MWMAASDKSEWIVVGQGAEAVSAPDLLWFKGE
jgi:predicted RNA-binding protein with PIN domain